MPFVIQNPGNGLYLNHIYGRSGFWVANLHQASHFSKQVRAENFLNNNFIHILPGVSPSEMRIVEITMDAKVAPCQTVPEQTVPEQTRTDSIDREDLAEELLLDLPTLIDELAVGVETVHKLEAFYHAQLKTADLESGDILHKIEFSNVELISGFLLYCQLREVRLRRRRAKDSLELLNLFSNSGLLSSIEILRNMLGKLQQKQTRRNYRPRVLTDLFEAFPAVSPQTPALADTAPAAEVNAFSIPPESEPSAETPPAAPELSAKTPPAAPEPSAETPPAAPELSAETPPAEPEPSAETPPAEPEPSAETPPVEPELSAETPPAKPEPSAETPPAEPELSAETPPAEPELSAETPPAEPELSAETPPAEPEPPAADSRAVEFAAQRPEFLPPPRPFFRRCSANTRKRSRLDPLRRKSTRHKPCVAPRRSLSRVSRRKVKATFIRRYATRRLNRK